MDDPLERQPNDMDQYPSSGHHNGTNTRIIKYRVPRIVLMLAFGALLATSATVWKLHQQPQKIPSRAPDQQEQHRTLDPIFSWCSSDVNEDLQRVLQELDRTGSFVHNVEVRVKKNGGLSLHVSGPGDDRLHHNHRQINNSYVAEMLV